MIIFNEKKSLNEKHIEIQLQHSNVPHITNQYSWSLKKKDKNYKIVANISLAESFEEQSILTKIRSIFPNENIIFQYHVLNNRIDAYLPKHKLAIEIDELGHVDRIKGQERQLAIEKELDCKFIRINPAKERFNVFNAIGIIQIFIAESNKKLTEKSTKESTK